jgi:glycosyltransferase involved in cell wall biosynthesis
MRVGLVCQNFPPATFEGGISHYSHHLAKALSKLSHKVIAITSTEFTKSAKDRGKVPPLPIRLVQGPWNRVSIGEIRSIAHADQLDALILQYSPASFKLSFRLAWALSRFPCQKVTAFHTLWGGGIDRAVGLSLLMGSDKIIATNSEIMTLLERHLPFFLRKTYWIPIGSNILPPERNLARIAGAGDPVFSYFGMLYPGKGLSVILSTLEGLKRRGCEFRFKFVGGGMLDAQNYEARFREEIAEKGLAGAAEHLGLLPDQDVSAWLATSRFVFLPYEMGLSDRRGSFMAAIAHGKAVLTSPPAVHMPYLKNGINALWPRRPTPERYADEAERLLKDDDLIRRLEGGARKLARQFQWNRIAEDHLLALATRVEG